MRASSKLMLSLFSVMTLLVVFGCEDTVAVFTSQDGDSESLENLESLLDGDMANAESDEEGTEADGDVENAKTDGDENDSQLDTDTETQNEEEQEAPVDGDMMPPPDGDRPDGPPPADGDLPPADGDEPTEVISCDDVPAGRPCCGDDTCDGPETAANCPSDCANADGDTTETPVGPVSCTNDDDCKATGACPDDATLGCTCENTPEGDLCIPSCNSNSDCPSIDGQDMTCSPQGTCIPSGPPH